MKSLYKFGIFVFILVTFSLFFLLGISLTNSTVKLTQFVTGINDWEYKIKEQTVVYYSDNTEMGKLGYKKEYSSDFPELLKKAVVAVEDRRFYAHNGLDSKGIARAVWNNIKRGKKSEGGSTITQQLARTLFLEPEKTYSRKIKEVFIASAIEGKYEKDAILNMYLNEVFIGRGCSGMQCAAESYFGKDVMQLNEAEITVLAGMIQSPEYYSPDKNMVGLKARQETVIDLLIEQGTISSEKGQAIYSQNISFKPYKFYSSKNPYYMAYLSAHLETIVGVQRLYQGGLKIHTTINRQMQAAAESSVKSNINGFKSRGINVNDAALVSIDPRTGGIKALVGGVNFENNQINMAVTARQPGSAIKPLYYALAMNIGAIDPDSVLNNRKRDFGGYMPENSGTHNPATATVREALVNSYNVASVEVLNRLGTKRALTFLTDLGITSIAEGDENLALALGGMYKGISPLQLASAYTIFPAQGIYRDYYTVEKIVDEQDKIIYKKGTIRKQVLKSKTADQMDEILKSVVNYGTGSGTRISIPSGGKTGTTTDYRDLWFVGYTSELVTAVWAGNSDNQPVKGSSTYGGTVAGPIWRDYMNRLIYSHLLEEAPYKRPAPIPGLKEDDTADGEKNEGEDEGEGEGEGEDSIAEEETPAGTVPQLPDTNQAEQLPGDEQSDDNDGADNDVENNSHQIPPQSNEVGENFGELDS